jgi:hypothetical protein
MDHIATNLEVGKGDTWDLVFSKGRVHLERGTLVFVLSDLCLRAKKILAILHTLIFFTLIKSQIQPI